MPGCSVAARSAMAISCRSTLRAQDRWLAIARLRFVLDAEHGAAPAARRQREYRRRLRRFLYAGSDAVMLEGVVERKSWLHDALSDLMVLVWHGESQAAARAAAMHDLARLERELARYDARLPDDGSVRLAFACAEIDDDVAAGSAQAARLRLHELVGRVLASSAEVPLARHGQLSPHSGRSVGRIVMRAFPVALIATMAGCDERACRRVARHRSQAHRGRVCAARVRRGEARDLAARHRRDDLGPAGPVVRVAGLARQAGLPARQRRAPRLCRRRGWRSQHARADGRQGREGQGHRNRRRARHRRKRPEGGRVQQGATRQHGCEPSRWSHGRRLCRRARLAGDQRRLCRRSQAWQEYAASRRQMPALRKPRPPRP